MPPRMEAYSAASKAVFEIFEPALELSLLTLLPAAVSLSGGAGFLWLLTQGDTPDGELIVERGDLLPRFEARDHHGEPFDSASLAGRRVLLKFFRGHW